MNEVKKKSGDIAISDGREKNENGVEKDELRKPHQEKLEQLLDDAVLGIKKK